MLPKIIEQNHTVPQSNWPANEAAGKTNYKELAQRIGGRKVLEQRMLKQAGIWAKAVHQGRGLFRFENIIPMDSIITFCLKISGMWAIGVSNYFDIKIVENHVYFSKLPQEFNGYRILQLTDLHCDLHKDFTAVLLKKLEGLDYDLAVFTGDYHNDIELEHDKSLEFMAQIIQAIPTPKVGILGNHDFIEQVAFLEEVGLPILLNENLEIRKEEEAIWICGIDDENFFGSADIRKASAYIPKNAFKLLLAHSPEVYKSAEAEGYDFMLSGHTHGGQICLPGGKIIHNIVDTPTTYMAGVWRFEQMQGYTSKGTGACGVPVRFNCPAEVTIHTLHTVP